MSETTISYTSPSRRDFISATAAAVAAAALPSAAAEQAPAKFRRLNVSNPAAARHLESYKKAITAMLNLPARDARNWYRIALLHTLDCPHGNWWFLVWHRGYIGWFEQICRELSEDPQFALPYWDWTAEPRVPAVMYDGVLTPNDPAYIAKATEFKDKFEEPVTTYWNSLNKDQINQLLDRGLRFPADLWFDINDDPRGGMFFDQPIARGLTKEKPGLDVDPGTAKAVSLPTLLSALSPSDFITFASPKTLVHSGLTGFGPLEQGPHNLVHNCVGGAYNKPEATGGFMQANLSPVDPLFFLHHANIDRLWDVWTRKQRGFKLPIFPDGFETPTKKDTDWDRWTRGRGAQFLFFVNEKGLPVSKTKAGDYAEIGEFNYDYEPGSGEEVVPTAAVAMAPPRPIGRFDGEITNRSVTTSAATSALGTITLPSGVAVGGTTEPNLFAIVTLWVPPAAHTSQFRVLLDSGIGAASQDAGVFAMFGHHNVTGPVTFTVPLRPAVTALRAENALGPNLNVRVLSELAPSPPHLATAFAAGQAAEVDSIVVEVH